MGEQARYKLEFSEEALRDLQEIVDFIAADNPSAAERFANKVVDKAEAIALHPLAGRMVPEFGTPSIRERIHRAYRIIYEIREEQPLIVVSRFWHAARGTPEV